MLFGKLPSHGDFVCRGMPDGERDAWDAWISEGLEAARAALGDAFETAHAAAPPWRFIAFAQTWRVGCLAPSMDRAGRRFVLVLAVEGLDWGEALVHGPALAERFSDAIYRILAEGLDAEQAYEIARACAIRPAGAGPTHALAALSQPLGDGVWWSEGGEMHAPGVESGAAPHLLLVRMLSERGS